MCGAYKEALTRVAHAQVMSDCRKRFTEPACKGCLDKKSKPFTCLLRFPLNIARAELRPSPSVRLHTRYGTGGIFDEGIRWWSWDGYIAIGTNGKRSHSPFCIDGCIGKGLPGFS